MLKDKKIFLGAEYNHGTSAGDKLCWWVGGGRAAEQAWPTGQDINGSFSTIDHKYKYKYIYKSIHKNTNAESPLYTKQIIRQCKLDQNLLIFLTIGHLGRFCRILLFSGRSAFGQMIFLVMGPFHRPAILLHISPRCTHRDMKPHSNYKWWQIASKELI